MIGAGVDVEDTGKQRFDRAIAFSQRILVLVVEQREKLRSDPDNVVHWRRNPTVQLLFAETNLMSEDL